MGAYTLALYHRDDFREAYYQRGLTFHQLDKDVAACEDLKKALDLGLEMAEKAIQKICK